MKYLSGQDFKGILWSAGYAGIAVIIFRFLLHLNAGLPQFIYLYFMTFGGGYITWIRWEGGGIEYLKQANKYLMGAVITIFVIGLVGFVVS